MDNEQVYQFIDVTFNKNPKTLQNATSILLTGFDISMCQSAIIKTLDDEYHTS